MSDSPFIKMKIKRLLGYLREYKKYAIIAPLLVVVEVFFDVAIPRVMSMIIDKGINGATGPDLGYVLKMGGVMVGMSVIAMLFGVGSGLVSAQAAAGFVKNLRLVLFDKIQDFSFANIDHFTVPSLVTRLTTDMRQIRMAFITITRMMVRSPVQLIFSFIMVATINLKLATVFLVAAPILFGGMLYAHHLAHPRFQVMMEKFDNLNATLEENLIGIRVVKTFVRGDYEIEKFYGAATGVRDAQRHAESVLITTEPFFQFVMYACMIAVSWFGGKSMINEEMTVGEFMSYLTYIKLVLFSLLNITFGIMQVFLADASITRVLAIIDEEIDITDDDADPNVKLEDGSIIFKDVNFKYSKDAEKYVLSNVDLEIKSGQVIGIIGPTGSSKSTLVNLIPRLYDVTEGEVIVGGHNVKDYTLENLRGEVAMVLQKNILFSGSIEENVKWGNMDASREEVIEACKYAQADDFITSFPDGYDTKIEQGGVNVSGGQQQRLCIARALMKKPKIIIMDDSTSAVDTDTDRRIRLALKEKLAGMTTIIIAQRIASVMEADQILVMENGEIVQRGTHDELMESSEEYRDLYTSQMQGVKA
ncbi:MAG: ABC transporter ATP-binding protein [Oscillospiraceae bacterium]|nr:ABC transporter ATP-binding protein [Oscillospiraceae bacterium]